MYPITSRIIQFFRKDDGVEQSFQWQIGIFICLFNFLLFFATSFILSNQNKEDKAAKEMYETLMKFKKINLADVSPVLDNMLTFYLYKGLSMFYE
jgi:hypothetical protein